MPRGIKKGVSSGKFDSAVRKIKKKGAARNPYAVANAMLGEKVRRRRKSSSQMQFLQT